MRLMLGKMVPLEGLYLFPIAVARDEIGLEKLSANTFFFSFELLFRAARRGYTYKVVTIQCQPRLAGKSKVANLRKILQVGSEIIDMRMRMLRGR